MACRFITIPSDFVAVADQVLEGLDHAMPITPSHPDDDAIMPLAVLRVWMNRMMQRKVLLLLAGFAVLLTQSRQSDSDGLHLWATTRGLVKEHDSMTRGTRLENLNHQLSCIFDVAG
jgi:hypothetical protein